MPKPMPTPTTLQVQGVFFRACAVEQARNLNLVGWVRNTHRGTVEGVAQGDAPALDKMKVRVAWACLAAPLPSGLCHRS